MKKFNEIIIIIVVVSLSFSYTAYAQVVISADGADPDASAILDVKSTTKGVLIPRMSETEIESIYNPTNGLVVFNTTDNKIYVFIAADNYWKVILYGVGTILAPWQCGVPFEYDGKSYATVQIGDQCWMAENLAYLPSVVGPATGSATTSHYYVYDYDGTDVTAAKATSNYDTYGVLYNWPAATAACPTGWHLPSDEEYKTLEIGLGLTTTEANAYGRRGTHDEGSELAGNEPLWNNGVLVGSGIFGGSGFEALPGGYRHTTTSYGFVSQSYYARFWSSSEPVNNPGWAIVRELTYDYTTVSRYDRTKASGFSVRCVLD